MRCFVYSINYYAKNVHVEFVEVTDKITLYEKHDTIDCNILASAELVYVEGYHWNLTYFEDMEPDKYSRRRRLGPRYLATGLEQTVVFRDGKPVLSSETYLATDRNFLDNIPVLKSRLDVFKLQNFIDKCLLMEL